MKKRRLVIGTFLLCAVLVMGIGFAAVADTLNITGRASFRSSAIVKGDVSSAIYFDPAYTPDVDTGADDDNVFPTKSATISAGEKPNAADLTLVINGVEGRTTPYVLTAVYKVNYDLGDGSLPTVTTAVNATLKDSGVDVPGFAIAAKLYEGETTSSAVVTEMEPGDTAYAIVTITYTTPAQIPTNVLAGTIDVTLHFSVPDEIT